MKYKTYTHKELNEFEKQGIAGQVCTCKREMVNTMTVECVICGKIQQRFAKRYVRRQKNG